jgi:hypothetical protein
MITPEFVTALTGLVVAIGTLVKMFMVSAQASETHETVKAIDVHTNGALTALQQSVKDMRSVQATPTELAARAEPTPEALPQP